jgi:hypothetical protein
VDLFNWSNKGNNEGLRAGTKRTPSGDGPGTWWSRTSDGSSGQSQSRKDPDGTVSYWQHDRSAGGRQAITEIKYHPNGDTTITKKS